MFRGRVRSLPLPPIGKLIELQVLLSGDWQTFRTVRTDCGRALVDALPVRANTAGAALSLPRQAAARSRIPIRSRHIEVVDSPRQRRLMTDNRTVRNTTGPRVIAALSRRLTYANVMSTLAVFIALGGSSYAALQISGSHDQEPHDHGHEAARQHADRRADPRVAAGARPARAQRRHARRTDRRRPAGQVPARHVPDRRRVRRAHPARRRVVRQRRAGVQLGRNTRSAGSAPADAR